MALLGKKHAIEHSEEVWLISYADMMTLLFGFFVILYSLSQVDDKKFEQVGKQLAEAFGGEVTIAQSQPGMQVEARQLRALQLLVTTLNLGENVDQGVRNLEKQITATKGMESAQQIIEANLKEKGNGAFTNLETSLKNDRMEVLLPDSVLFESGTACLKPSAKEGLKRVAGYLAKVKKFVGVEVVGHTDSQPAPLTSKFSDNWSLSAARAGVVAAELIKNGVDPKTVTASGLADLDPLFPDRRADGTFITENLAKNRRVVLVVKKVRDAKKE